MTNLLKWPGLDLPVFDGTEPFCHHFNLPGEVIRSTNPTLVRLCEMEIPPDSCAGKVDSLADVISITDDHLLRLEMDYGVPSVPHKWGLFPVAAAVDQHPHQRHYLTHPHPASEYHRHHGYHLLPPDMLLAAEVVIIDQLITDPDIQAENSIYSYYQEVKGFYVRDLRTSQTVYGKPRPNPQTQAIANYIVDIEPRIGFV